MKSAKSDADATDNGTTTGDYPSQGDPHPIGTYPFLNVTVKTDKQHGTSNPRPLPSR